MTTEQDWRHWRFDGGDKWSNWFPFSEVALAEVHASAGAYVLGLPASHGRGTLGRLLGEDPHGLLDVGEAGNLRDRLLAFRRCASMEGERGHMAGWRLGSMGLLNRLGINADDLRMSVCYATSKDDAYRVEGTILRIYYDPFGELPPLNYKFNWSTWEET
jgi:hypothetical protein